MTGAEVLVWIAGTRWDDAVPGTDRRLATAVSRTCPVLWIDPPLPWRPGRSMSAQPIVQVADGIMRVRAVGPPGVTRPGIRHVTADLLGRAVRHALAELGVEPLAVLTSFPLASFPRDVAGLRVLYVTDDWLGGANQMGLSESAVRSVLVRNLGAADVAAAVSPLLAAQLDGIGRAADPRRPPTMVLANGCPAPTQAVPRLKRQAVVGLVGQLNERLDLGVLEAVQATGVPIRVVGPRVEATRAYRLRLTGFLNSPNVSWSGAVPASQVPAELATLGVGLTPYADTAFNRASFPLKTLEYLAAGLAVVSTDLPSVRWLASDLVGVSSDPSLFAGLVLAALDHRDDEGLEQRRREFASTHTWEKRADELLGMVGRTSSGVRSADGRSR